MKILYLPLDERPCNYDFPRMNLSPHLPIELITIPRNLLGRKKTPGDPAVIQSWVIENLSQCDAAVVSLETLVFGGLLASRLHCLSVSEAIQRLDSFANLVDQVKKGKDFSLYLFGLVMRTPGYSSDEEEPDYYAHYGRELFMRAFLDHKATVVQLSEEELSEQERLKDFIPAHIRKDYENRRQTNVTVLAHAGKLFARNTINVLVIPQDDTAEYGYGPMDKERLTSCFSRHGILKEVLSYPGADEVGCSLTARAIVEGLRRGIQPPSIWIEPRDRSAALRIPKYEGLPLLESCRLQVLASGCTLAADPVAADLILAVNTSDDPTLEARTQPVRRATDFISHVRTLSDGKAILMADVAYPNGGDTSLLEAIDQIDLWPRLYSYAGWNTSGNTLGTAISRGLLEFLGPDEPTRMAAIAYRIFDDWAYQSILRWELTETLTGDSPHQNEHLSAPCPELGSSVPARLNELVRQHLPRFYSQGYRVTRVDFPWSRLFEIGLTLEGSCKT